MCVVNLTSLTLNHSLPTDDSESVPRQRAVTWWSARLDELYPPRQTEPRRSDTVWAVWSADHLLHDPRTLEENRWTSPPERKRDGKYTWKTKKMRTGQIWPLRRSTRWFDQTRTLFIRPNWVTVTVLYQYNKCVWLNCVFSLSLRSQF